MEEGRDKRGSGTATLVSRNRKLASDLEPLATLQGSASIASFVCLVGTTSLPFCRVEPARRMFTSWRAGWLSCLFRKAPQHDGNGGQLAWIKLVYQAINSAIAPRSVA
jgi:hypothetical protein